MFLFVIDAKPELRATLVGRAREAIRQSEIKRCQAVEIDPSYLEGVEWSMAMGCLIGPGFEGSLEEIVARLRKTFPVGKIGVLLRRETYVAQAMALRKRLDAVVMVEGDMTQLAGFVIDCEGQGLLQSPTFKNRGVIGVIQFKGGVGATSVVAALGACWSAHEVSVAAIDLDDVNPQLTAWARPQKDFQKAVSECLRQGDVPVERLNSIASPIEGYKNFVIVPQPESYNEAFHLKANVLDEVPSASGYVEKLIEGLKREFDVILIDMGRSWGVATFSILPLCSKVILVTDDDAMSVRRSIECLLRLKRESDDLEEFNFDKWSVLLNAHTGELLDPGTLQEELELLDIFPPNSDLFVLSFSIKGRQWGAAGESMYELGEEEFRDEIASLAGKLVPIVPQERTTLLNRVIKKFRKGS